MPSRTAFRLCPQAVFLPARFEVYRAVSAHIMQIFHTFTDLVEPLSLDEAYLDVTKRTNNWEEATLLVQAIKQQIRERTQLTGSAGVSYGYVDTWRNSLQMPANLMASHWFPQF